MAIECIAGLPGGGKSYWGVERLCDHIAKGGCVITNLPIRGLVDTGKEGREKYVLGPDAPLRAWLRCFRKWEYQEGQLYFLDQKMISGNWVPLLPKGTPRKHLLMIFDEMGDSLDSLDGGRLKTKDDYYRRLFEYFRLHRHLYHDVVVILQDYGTMNARIRALCDYVHVTMDMQGRRLAGIPIPYLFPKFWRFTYDKRGKHVLKESSAVKEKSVFELYDSYNDHGNFNLDASVTVDFTGAGDLTKKGQKKMTKLDRLLMLGGFAACIAFSFMMSKGSGPASSAAARVQVVTVTNTVSVGSAALASAGSASAAPGPAVEAGPELPAAERITVEYCPLSFSAAGEDRWAYAQGRLFRLGMSTPQGRVVDIQPWGIRIVGSRGEHWIYSYDAQGLADNNRPGGLGLALVPPP